MASELLFWGPVRDALPSSDVESLCFREEGCEGPRQEADKGTEAWAIGPALGIDLGADLAMTRSRWEGTGGAVQDKVQVVTWEAGRQRRGSHGGGGAGQEGAGLSHSLRHVALHADETRGHKSDLARGHMPAHEPGQAGHLDAEDLDEVPTLEGHLLGPGALVVGHC